MNNNNELKEQSNVTNAKIEAKSGKNYFLASDRMNLIPELQQLKNIKEQVENCVNKNLPIKKQTNLYQLVSSKNLMIISHTKLSKNAALTESSNLESLKDFSIDKIEKLSQKMKNKEFKWSYIKKLGIKRLPKNSLPQGLPNYSEKLIQNNILMILETIYKPIFKKNNKSLEFRSNKSCKKCINLIKNYNNQGLKWTIEGNIQSSFDNVHVPTLAKILQEKIDDKDFVNLIYDLCITSNIKKSKIVEGSPMTTFQASIISPILFNIYMHKFDTNIIKILDGEVEKSKKISYYKINPEYKKQSYQIEKTRKKLTKYENIKKLRQLNSMELKIIQKIKSKLSEQLKNHFKTEKTNPEKLKLKYVYNRYDGNFLILINKDKKTCEIIKEKIINYLKSELRLTVSPEKMLVTNLQISKAKYLGFTIFMSKRKTAKNNGNNKLISKNGQQILIGIDLERIYKKLVKENYALEKTLEPTHKSSLAKLEPQEIIEHYNSLIKGIYNYYFDIISYKSQLNRIHYILYCSAHKTLALKHQTTISKIIKKYGWKEVNSSNKPTFRTRIVYTYKILDKQKKPKQKYSILLNRNDISKIEYTKEIKNLKNSIYY